MARLGLKADYGQRVEKYFEDGVAGVGGVVTQTGLIRVAHIVVAADANRTSSELLIAGEPMPSQSRGMSVYRTALPTELAMRHEAFKKRWGESMILVQTRILILFKRTDQQSLFLPFLVYIFSVAF